MHVPILKALASLTSSTKGK